MALGLGQHHCCRFDSIPEVPCNGALIKVHYAGAYMASNIPIRSRAFSTGSSASDSTPNQLNLRAARNSVDEEDDSSDEEKLVILRNSSGRTKDVNSGGSPSLAPKIEICGRIEWLGEDVDEEMTNLDIGDAVLVLPDDESFQSSEYLEYVSVSKLSDLVLLPQALSMEAAVQIPTGAYSVLPVLKSVREHCLKSEYKDPPKALLVGTDELVRWAISLWPNIFGVLGDGCQLTLALQDDSSLWFEKFHESINLVQWDNDVYDAQLIERTEQVCHGKVDIILDLEGSPKFFKRSMSCLRTNGHAFIGKSTLNSSMKNFITKTFKKDVHVIYVDNGTTDDFQELIRAVINGQTQMLPYQVFTTTQAGEVRRALSSHSRPFRPIFKLIE
ncbi:hypothetical protein TCAL_08912 [Tigriopus californicus]|uniref:Enoyl reductase (ER) domain-containing protein n=1 Tax=Tigriopus californicus TaxID=6832 RepID=A0A553P012_TIGCA|nr:uncharacterized protein LOC131886487 [Tigriopus californicus]TRY71030.1 hypothetical protein TCAL_08912 [Tigriopus californicus]